MFEDNLYGEFYFNLNHNEIQFFNKKCELGDILLENNKWVTNKYLNFQLFSNQLIWLRTTDYSKIKVLSNSVKEFIIRPKDKKACQIFRKINVKPWYRIDSTKRFLQILVEGEFNLYVYRSITNESYPIKEYYYQFNNNISYFKPRRSILYRLAGEKHDIMKMVVQKNHLHIKKEADLITAIQLFNQVLKTKN